jgi:hypothetical protein
MSANDGVNTYNETVKTSNLPSPPQDEEPSEVIQPGPCTVDPLPPTEKGEDIQLAATNNQAELMRWYYQLGHLSFPKLKQLALNGEIRKKLAKIMPPKCAGCLFGAMTKLPWQGKETKAFHKVFNATKPGECVSVNQMTSTQVGFYMQLKGRLTMERNKCATVFVDHFSCLCFVHLQLNTSSEETIATKNAFEQFDAEHGVKNLHCHCDNGRFYDNAFSMVCQDARQKLTFCGVNAHFQNGIDERAIRDLSESTHKQLLYPCFAGLGQCVLPYGHMHCAMRRTSTIAYQCWRMAHQG